MREARDCRFIYFPLYLQTQFSLQALKKDYREANRRQFGQGLVEVLLCCLFALSAVTTHPRIIITRSIMERGSLSLSLFHTSSLSLIASLHRFLSRQLLLWPWKFPSANQRNFFYMNTTVLYMINNKPVMCMYMFIFIPSVPLLLTHLLLLLLLVFFVPLSLSTFLSLSLYESYSGRIFCLRLGTGQRHH